MNIAKKGFSTKGVASIEVAEKGVAVNGVS
jgi:hypothetical protein